MANSYYKSVRIKPSTMLSEVFLTGDIDYRGVLLTSTEQQTYDTYDPYLLKYLTEEEKAEITLDDARKIELGYIITNSIKMWLQSKVGDYGRPNPGMGGPLDEYIGKIISEDKAEEIRASLEDKIIKTFGTMLTIESLTVSPIPDQRKYQIQLTSKYILVNKLFSVNSELRV